jgi:cytoskeleton protein RodZ
MSAGIELRLAREKRGWSQEELSARTRISLQVLQAIEEGHFERLPPVTYLRGFLRSYASEVGLPVGAIVDSYLTQCQSAQQALTAFDSESAVLETTILDRTLALRVPESVRGEAFQPEALSPAPLPIPSAAGWASTSRAIARVIALAAGVVVVAAAGFAVRSLGPDAQPVTLSAMPSSMSAAPAPAPAAPQPAAVEEATRTPPVTAARASAPVPADVSAAPAASEAPTPMLSGVWDLTNEVQSTSYRAFHGLQLGYRLNLAQDGAIVTGRGEKWSENGREIPASRRTPIAVAGTLHQGRLELSFTERGTRRSSAGRFVWQISDDGALRGTFVSDAASSRGSSLARRLP